MDEPLCSAFYKRYKRMEKAVIEQLDNLSESSSDSESQCSSDNHFIMKFNNPMMCEQVQTNRVKSPFVNNVGVRF